MPSFIDKSQIDEKRKAQHKEKWKADIRRSLQMPGTHRAQAKAQLKLIDKGREYNGKTNASPGSISNKTQKYASCCRLKK